MRSSFARMFGLIAIVGLVGGCKSMNSAFWGAMGYEKRDLLVSHVQKARDEQNSAKQDFKSALDQFKALTGAGPEASLQAKYDKLKSAYDDAAARAKKVTDRIAQVEYSANDLFKEWQKEIGEYNDANLRRQSEQRLQETKQRYAQLLGIMKTAESKMTPVLRVFNDQTLRLKHELNASAIAALQGQATQIESDVAALVADMEKSINEANAFISQLGAK